MVNKYAYTVSWSQVDEVFVARVAEFPLLAAHGDTQEEALGEIRFVVEDVIRDMMANNERVPEPLGSRRYSGKTVLRMPPSLHQALALEAERDGMSLNQFINLKLSRTM
jgi:predicted HicB family RNase H-like nuclease